MQFAPGGPSKRIIAGLQGQDQAPRRASRAAAATSGGAQGRAETPAATPGAIAARRDSTRRTVRQLEKQFGFDRPSASSRCCGTTRGFDFGKSYFRDVSVLQLIELPVSITLGLWMTLLSYAISIPLGIKKAKCGTARPSTCGPPRW